MDLSELAEEDKTLYSYVAFILLLECVYAALCLHSSSGTACGHAARTVAMVSTGTAKWQRESYTQLVLMLAFSIISNTSAT